MGPIFNILNPTGRIFSTLINFLSDSDTEVSRNSNIFKNILKRNVDSLESFKENVIYTFDNEDYVVVKADKKKTNAENEAIWKKGGYSWLRDEEIPTKFDEKFKFDDKLTLNDLKNNILRDNDQDEKWWVIWMQSENNNYIHLNESKNVNANYEYEGFKNIMQKGTDVGFNIYYTGILLNDGTLANTLLDQKIWDMLFSQVSFEIIDEEENKKRVYYFILKKINNEN